MATEQKKSWTQKLRSFGKSTSKETNQEKAKESVSEASTAVQETAQQASEATQEAVQQGVTSAQETAETAAKSTKDAMNKTSTQETPQDLGITFSDEPTLAPAATTAPDVVPSPGDMPATSMPTSSTSWLDQVKEGLHQGFTTVSQKTMEGYEAAKDMMGPSSSDGPSWTETLKDGFHQGVTTVTEKTSQGYEAAKEYMTSSSAAPTVARASAQNEEPSTTSTTSSWSDQFQSSFTMCLSTVQEKTQQGYEATMEFVVGKHESPTSTIEVEGQHAASSASTSISKGIEGAKSAMQQGVESAQAAMKPKNAKVGGA